MLKIVSDELKAFAMQLGFEKEFVEIVTKKYAKTLFRNSRTKGKYIDFEEFRRLLKIEKQNRERKKYTKDLRRT